jgi:gp16 family phage-associated protein
MPTPLTPEQAREALNEKGMSIAEFSRIHGLNRQMVSDLLNGRKKGLRGEAHRAAVLLGIKKGVIADRPKSVRPKPPHQ